MRKNLVVDLKGRKEFRKNAKAFLGKYPLQGIDYEDVYGFKPTSAWFKAYEESISSYCIDEEEACTSISLESLLAMEASGISPEIVAECVATYNLIIITPNIYQFLSRSEYMPESARELAELFDAAWYEYIAA